MAPNLGHLLAPDAPRERDAVHIAVLPVQASELLVPGDDVGLDPQGMASSNAPAIGIVDPFLHEAVGTGEWFWLFIYPNAVTALRHNWTHPIVDPKPPEPTPAVAPIAIPAGDDEGHDQFCCGDEG